MKKVNYFLAIISLGLFISSCNKDKADGSMVDLTKTANVEFTIEGITKSTTRAAGIHGPLITDPAILEQLIENVRILAFDQNNICIAVADFDPSFVHADNVVQMAVPVGIVDFVLLTNSNHTEVMDKPSIIGSTKNDILVKLKDHPDYVENHHFAQSHNIFHFAKEDVTVVANPDYTANENVIPDVKLARMVSQLETTVQKDMVYDVTGIAGVVQPGYIMNLDRIKLRNISADMNMVKMLENRAPAVHAANNVIIEHAWDATTPASPKNTILTFPTEQLGVKPFIIIAAEVDESQAPFFVADPTDVNGPNGHPIRYWALQLQDNFLRENVRLNVDVTKLIGPGSPTPPDPESISTVQFTVSVCDWDPTIDTETGEAI